MIQVNLSKSHRNLSLCVQKDRLFLTLETDCHDITEILLKVALNTIALTPLELYLKFGLYRIMVYSDFGLDGFRCITR